MSYKKLGLFRAESSHESSGWNAFYIVPALTDQAGQCRIVTRRVDNKIDAADSYRASPELWAEAGLMSSSGKLVCLNDAHAFTAMAESEPLSAGVQFNFPINGE